MPTATRHLKYAIYPEDDAFTAQCLNIDIASEGDSEQEALANLREALELYFEGGVVSVEPTPSGAVRFGELVITT
jgi:predicted RNase H-like HicB family nuclease